MPQKNLLVFALFLAFFQIFAAPQTSAQQMSERLDYRERFVLQSVRTILGAQYTYQATAGAGAYGTLEDLKAAGFIDPALAAGEKNGYVFALSVTPPTGTDPAKFHLTATPRRYPKSGRRSFYIDQTGGLRGADKNGAPATNTDPLITSCSAAGIFVLERCVLSEMRTLHGAEMTYQASVGAGSFGSFAQLLSAGLINSVTAGGSAHGYSFALVTFAPTSNTPAFFTFRATPTVYGENTRRSFYIDAEGVIRGGDKQGLPADQNDPPIPD